MKKTVAILIVGVLSIAGCQQKFQDSRKQAYDRWYAARAQMLCNVADNNLKCGKVTQAAKQAREAKALAPDLFEARLLMGKVFIEQGSYAAAVEELSEASKLKEDNPKGWYYLGVAQEKNTKPQDALKSYAKSIELDAYNVDAIIAQSQVLVETGNISRAKRLLDKNFPIFQNDLACVELFGRIAMMDEDYQKAADVYSFALELADDNLGNRILYSKALIRCGKFDQAKDELCKILENEKYQSTDWLYTMLGDSYQGIGNHQQAIESYIKACQITPDQPGNWASLAQAQLSMGMTEQAENNAQRALKLQKDHLQGAMIKAYILARQGKPSLALATLYPVSQKHPENPTLLCLMGRCHELSGDKTQAKDFYNRAITLAPQNNVAQLLVSK